MPGLPALLRLAGALGVPVERFAEGVEDPAEPDAAHGPISTKKEQRCVMVYWPGLVLLLVLALLPGAMAGLAIAWPSGQRRAGLCRGTASGAVGSFIGLALYWLYVRTLPSEWRQDEWGPYRRILDPPPQYVAWLSFIVGGLLCAILYTAIVVRRPVASVSKDSGQKGSMRGSRAEPSAAADRPRD
jgi:hypothetical protein